MAPVDRPLLGAGSPVLLLVSACLLQATFASALAFSSDFFLTVPVTPDEGSYRAVDDGFSLEANGTVLISLVAQPTAPLTSATLPFLPSAFALVVKVLSTETSAAYLGVSPASPQSACFVPAVFQRYHELNVSASNAAELLSTSVIETFHVPTAGGYVVGVFLCQKGYSGSLVSQTSPLSIRLRVQLDYVFINPGGAQSTLEDIPLVQVFLSVTVLYLIMAVVSLTWLVYYQVRARPTERPNRMQWLLWVALVGKLGDAGLSALARSLVDSADKDADALTRVSAVVNIIADVVFLGTQLLLCRGYHFAYPTLQPYDRQLLVTCLFVHGVFLSANNLDTNNEDMQEAYKYATTMTRLAVTGVALICLALTTEKVRKSMIVGRDTIEGRLEAYLRFSAFWPPFAVYVVVPLVVLVMDNTVISWKNRYVAILLSELTTAYYFLIVMYHFRQKAAL